jgi:hypothetical protein
VPEHCVLTYFYRKDRRRHDALPHYYQLQIKLAVYTLIHLLIIPVYRYATHSCHQEISLLQLIAWCYQDHHQAHLSLMQKKMRTLISLKLRTAKCSMADTASPSWACSTVSSSMFSTLRFTKLRCCFTMCCMWLMTAYQTLPTDAGVIHAHEYVNFIREPHNPYDRNAIRVVNMAGIQVSSHETHNTALCVLRVQAECISCRTHSSTC